MKANDDPTISRKADEFWRFTVRCNREHPGQYFFRYFTTQEAGIQYMSEGFSEEAQRLATEEYNANPDYGMDGLYAERLAGRMRLPRELGHGQGY